jgi:hypothetical protein
MMKEVRKNILITAMIGLSNLINAQAVVNNSLVPAELQEAEIGIQVPTPLVGLMMPNFQATNENVLFYEDFANGFDGNNGVGAWTAEDTGEGQIWQHVDVAGNGYYVDGTASGVQPPAGEFSTTVGPLNSTTAANGWMIFDNDFYNTPIADGSEDTEGWITSPSLDFSASGSVIISWEQYFRYCCQSYAPIYIQVSNDGGVNWTTFDAHGTFIESANTTSANALTTSVDISCVAANSADVQIRFSYLQPPEIGGNYSHYYWGIDDVTIFENITAHNLAITQVFNGDVITEFEYNVTPMEQVAPESEGGLVVGVEFQNLGYASQQNVEAILKIYDDLGAIVHTHIETLGVVPSASDDVNCPSDGLFVTFFSSLWTPSDTGSYDMKIILSSENIEATILDNEMSKSIEYTLDEMGHDVEPLDYEFTPDADPNSPEILYEPCGYGNQFLMQNEGSAVHGLNIKFGPNSGGADLNFATRLFGSDTGEEYETAYWNFNELVSSITYDPSEWVYLPFQTPIELNPGTAYFAAVMNDSYSESQLTVMGNSTGDVDNSTVEYENNSVGGFSWFTAGGVVPAIRLVLSPQDFAGCTDAIACNFNSVATIDDGSCIYETCGCMDEEACNYDAGAEFDDGSCCVCIEAGITMDVGLDYLVGTWQLSSAAGAFSIGPEPLSGEWFSSVENGLEATQYDDSWSFYPGGEFVYSNSGSTVVPWLNYTEQVVTFEPAFFEVSDNGPFFGGSTFSISGMLSNELGLVCGWFGAMDSGPEYEVLSITETSLTVVGQQSTQDCNVMDGFWTLTFEKVEGIGFCSQGCFDEMACNYDPDVIVVDNDSCFFPDEGQDCDGFCIDPAACDYAEDPILGVSIYTENFESFNAGDYISSNNSWNTWSGSGGGNAEDAQVSADEANESDNSLHIYGSSEIGGPMDVVLTVGLDGGVCEASFWMFIPVGSIGYYNIQENVAPGVGWALEVTFADSGDFQVVADADTVASGSFPLGQWFEVHHLIDMDNDVIALTIDGVESDPFLFDSPFGGINFFSLGDGATLSSYFIDDIEINVFNGSVPAECTYPGCQDLSALNYDPEAGCSADCNYLTYDCASIGDEAWVDEVMGLFPEWQDAMHGVPWEGEWVFNVPATVIEPSSEVSYGLHHVEWTEISGIPSWATTDYTLTDLEASSQHCIAASGTPTEPGMHEIVVSGEVFISVFGQPFSIGIQSYSAWLEVLDNSNPIPGCTYANAVNFVVYATADDGSCLFGGCTDEAANNFNPIATIDDGSCGEECEPGVDSSCSTDANNDGTVSVSDLLILLGEFGTDCE